MLVAPEICVVGLKVHVRGAQPIRCRSSKGLHIIEVRRHERQIFLHPLQHSRIFAGSCENLRSDLSCELFAFADEGRHSLLLQLFHLHLSRLLRGILKALFGCVRDCWLQEGVVAALVVPGRKVRHFPKDAVVDLSWVVQQVVLVLAADRQQLKRSPLEALDGPPIFYRTTLTERDFLQQQDEVGSVPVDVAEIQLRYPERKKLFAAQVRQKFWGIQVGVARHLHSHRLFHRASEEVPGELGEELRMQIRVRLLELQSDEGLVTSTASAIET
mmetsp:Transcript_78342/g.162774  ORF Transcript_78342/g.162774 Transcript_78342/m.162774 type:complete len:272 (-) Transcript_78342:378-1193(-)